MKLMGGKTTTIFLIISLFLVSFAVAETVTTFSDSSGATNLTFINPGHVNNTSITVPTTAHVYNATVNLTGYQVGYTLLGKLTNGTHSMYSTYVDDLYIYGANDDGKLYVWNKTTYELVRNLTGITNLRGVYADDTHIYGAGLCYIRVWNKDDFTYNCSLSCQSDTYWNDVYVDDIYIYGANLGNHYVCIWNKSDFTLKKKLTNGTNVMQDSHADDLYIYGANGDGYIYVWNKSDFTLEAKVFGASPISGMMKVHSDDTYFYGATQGAAKFFVWNKTNFENTENLTAPFGTHSVYSDGGYIYGGVYNIYVWNATSFTLEDTLTDCNNSRTTEIYVNGSIVYASQYDTGDVCMINNNNESFPQNVLFFVANSTTTRFNNTGEGDFNVTNTSDDFSIDLNTYGSGVVYFNVSTEATGIIELSDLNIKYIDEMSYNPTSISKTIRQGFDSVQNLSLNSSIEDVFDFNYTWNPNANYGTNLTFTFTPDTIGANASWNETELNISANALADNATTFYGNITITRMIDGYEGWNISVEITVETPAGNIEVVNAGTNTWQESLYEDESIYRDYPLTNLGNYPVSNINLSIEAYGGYPTLAPHLTFNETDFTMEEGEDRTIRATISNPPINYYYQNYLQINGWSTSSRLTTDTLDTQPGLVITSMQQPPTRGGGGGAPPQPSKKDCAFDLIPESITLSKTTIARTLTIKNREADSMTPTFVVINGVSLLGDGAQYFQLSNLPSTIAGGGGEGSVIIGAVNYENLTESVSATLQIGSTNCNIKSVELVFNPKGDELPQLLTDVSAGSKDLFSWITCLGKQYILLLFGIFFGMFYFFYRVVRGTTKAPVLMALLFTVPIYFMVVIGIFLSGVAGGVCI